MQGAVLFRVAAVVHPSGMLGCLLGAFPFVEHVPLYGVQHLVHAPTHMATWPAGPRQSRIVFILENLDPDLIRRPFAAFMGLIPARIAA